jgi:hypothetical protein
MDPNILKLTAHNTHVMALALVALLWDETSIKLVVLLPGDLVTAYPVDLHLLRKVLGPDLLRVVLAVDPMAPQRAADLNIVPELPEPARLPETQREEAWRIGEWLNDYVAWAVKVRCSIGMAEYLQIAGGRAAGLYRVDNLPTSVVALFCERESDALLVAQEVRTLVSTLILGSAVHPLSQRWLIDLMHCRLMLVAYDRHEQALEPKRQEVVS